MNHETLIVTEMLFLGNQELIVTAGSFTKLHDHLFKC